MNKEEIKEIVREELRENNSICRFCGGCNQGGKPQYVPNPMNYEYYPYQPNISTRTITSGNNLDKDYIITN